MKKIKSINILSLFDGISCGRVALERAKIKVNKYYASEIDKNAIKVTMKNYPNTIQLGNVIDVKTENLEKIDLLIGGSPCQGFSFAGKQLNFNDPRSQLFFEYVRLLKEIRKTNPEVKFLLENVRMKKEYQDVISGELGVKPILINSARVSAQNRQRLYWTNIPGIKQPRNKKLSLNKVLGIIEECKGAAKRNQVTKDGVKPFLNIRKDNKSNCVVSSYSKKLNGVIVNSIFRPLTPLECERLQTLPDNYTSDIKELARYKSLGNCWTVNVIVHFFKKL